MYLYAITQGTHCCGSYELILYYSRSIDILNTRPIIIEDLKSNTSKALDIGRCFIVHFVCIGSHSRSRLIDLIFTRSHHRIASSICKVFTDACAPFKLQPIKLMEHCTCCRKGGQYGTLREVMPIVEPWLACLSKITCEYTRESPICVPSPTKPHTVGPGPTCIKHIELWELFSFEDMLERILKSVSESNYQPHLFSKHIK